MALGMLNGSGFAGDCLRKRFKNLLVQVGGLSPSGRNAVAQNYDLFKEDFDLPAATIQITTLAALHCRLESF